MKKQRKRAPKSFINLSVQDVKMTYQNPGYKLSKEETDSANATYNAVRDRFAAIKSAVKESKTNAPQKGEGTMPWLTRRSNKWALKMKETLKPDTYKGIFSENFFRWDSPEGLAIIAAFYSSDFGICDEEHSKALEATWPNELTAYPYGTRWSSPRSSSLQDELVKSLAGLAQLVLNPYEEGSVEVPVKFSRDERLVKKSYKGHFGFHKDVPIVTEPLKEFYDLLMLRNVDLDETNEIQWSESMKQLQASITHECFDEMNSQIARLCKEQPNGPYRPFLEKSEIVNGNYLANPFIVQENLKAKLANYPDLLALELQSRKIGPRSAGTQDQFWAQVKDTYDVPTLTERAKRDLAEATDECIKLWLDHVGKVEPIPYVAGITSLADIEFIHFGVHSSDEKLADESVKLWDCILEASLGQECVYAYVKKNTNKGAPYYTSKITNIEWLNLVFNFFDRSVDPLEALNTFPFIPGQRLQNSTPSDDGTTKVRDRIIMQMSAIYIAHQAYNNPFLKAMKTMPEFVSYKSHDDVGIAMEEALKGQDPELNTYLLSQDYSGYDKCMGGELLEPCIWKFFESVFVNTTTDKDYLHNLFQGEWKHFYTKAPLIVPGGVKTGAHGLFSGAPGTGIVGSVMNWIRTKAMEKHFNVKFLFNYFQGDDTALCYQAKEKIELGAISSYLAEFGHLVQNDVVKQAYMEVKPDKSAWVMFVGKYYFIKSTSGLKLFKPIYSVVDMVARFVHPEQTKMSIEENSIRDWSEYDYNENQYIYRDAKAIDPMTGVPVVSPSISMAVRITQSLMNIEHHPLSNEVVIDLVKSAPGLFKGLHGYADVKDYYTFENDGTLIGKSDEEMRSSFLASPTAKLVMDTLTETNHVYKNIIYMEDLTGAISNYKVAKKRMLNPNDTASCQAISATFKTILKQKFENISLSAKAMRELDDLIANDPNAFVDED